MSLPRQSTATLLAVLLAALTTAPVAAAPVAVGVSFDEASAGDLSDESTAPTALGTFAAGWHTVSGMLGPDDNDDFFNFVVDGFLEAITLESRSGAGNTFIGLFAEHTAPLGAQIGDGFFAAAEVGGSPFNTRDPFAGGPLDGGNYSIGLTNLQGVGYTLSFSVAPVPLPAAWLALLPATGVLVRRRRAG